MANKTIKGLTVEIGGDTTQLGKALESVDQKSRDLSSELGQINRLLKLDPSNTELLAQKQGVLADAITNTSKRLDALKEAEQQVQAQFERGEVSEEQVRALRREIIQTENKLKSYTDAAEETADAIENIGKEAKASAEDLDSFANKGLATVGALVTAASGALVAAAESTREYRTEMAKLDTAFKTSGHSSETATKAYTELQGILGDGGQAAEAASHLALLVDNEKDLTKWTGSILPGIFATFGASLPVEGLAEAANHTAKLGEVQGPLADALEWMGMTTDDFNESLAKCNDEQERQELITKTLTDLYGEAGVRYRITNQHVISANKANEAWMASMAKVGETIEPVITDIKMMGAELLGKLVPAIEWVLANLPTVAIALGGIVAALVSYKIAAIAATAAEQGLTLAQYAAAAAQKALNTVMLANPIGVVILAITALAAAFTYLWKNNEDFRQFWIDLWAKIKDAAAKAVDWLKGLPERISGAIDGAKARVTAWGTNLVNTIKTAATNMLNNAASTLQAMPSRVASAISGAINSVVKWGSDMLSKAKTGMKNVVNGVVDTLSSLPETILEIGGDLVTGLWNGINNKLSWLKKKIKSFTNSVLDSIKSFFGVNSPSKETAWIGDMLDQGLAKGMLDSIADPIGAAQRVASGVLDATASGVNGMALERQLQQPVAASASMASYDNGLGAKLDKILAAIERGQILTIDGDQLVGATVGMMDSRLGKRRELAARGAL